MNAAEIARLARATLDGSMPFPAIAAEFDRAALKAAIVDSQQHDQKFRDFCERAVRAGVQGYFAYLRGLRVTYSGRQGDAHTEWFPGAGPKDG